MYSCMLQLSQKIALERQTTLNLIGKEIIMWTLFWDMHSGGGTKEDPYESIYIEASEKEAVVIFYNRFGHNPERVSCTCCGEDYSISESKTFKQASAYHRGCVSASSKNGKKWQYFEASENLPEGWKKSKYDSWDKYQTVAQYKRNKNVLTIPKSKILQSERIGEVPQEGYVWM